MRFEKRKEKEPIRKQKRTYITCEEIDIANAKKKKIFDIKDEELVNTNEMVRSIKLLQ